MKLHENIKTNFEINDFLISIVNKNFDENENFKKSVFLIDAN